MDTTITLETSTCNVYGHNDANCSIVVRKIWQPKQQCTQDSSHTHSVSTNIYATHPLIQQELQNEVQQNMVSTKCTTAPLQKSKGKASIHHQTVITDQRFRSDQNAFAVS